MTENKNKIKSATNRDQVNYEINRVVVESYTSIRGSKFQIDKDKSIKEISKSVTIAQGNENKIKGKKNIDNNSQSLNELDQDVIINDSKNKDNGYNGNLTKSIENNNNLNNQKNLKTTEIELDNLFNSNNEEIENNEINKINVNISNNLEKNTPKAIPSFSICPQNNFNLSSHIKSFDLPLSINNSSLNYLSKNEQREKNSTKNNLIISSLNSIFIKGEQNSNGKKNLSMAKAENIVHKEITDFKISKKKIIEKVNIDLDNLTESLKAINKRWKESQKESKIRLSYISKNEILILDKKKYIDDLVKNVSINNTNPFNNNKKEYFLLIKQDNQNKSDRFIHEIISPSSYQELENSINDFINFKEVKIYTKEYNKRTSQNIIYISDKKKSKFGRNNEISKKNSEENGNVKDNGTLNEYFNPFFILNQKQIINLLTILEKKSSQCASSSSSSINNSSQKINVKSSKKENLYNENKNIKEINSNIYPIKVERFEFIHNNEIGIGGVNNLIMNNNIDVSNIALNQSDNNYVNQMKAESEYSVQKIKETEDFSQCTPISLLKDKYFVYAVSKWAKYSTVSQQSQLFIKFNFKSGHPKFDPLFLDMTNFTLWIEKIHTKKDSKQLLAHASSGNINYMIKNKSSSKINNNKNKVYKSGAAIFLNASNGHTDSNNPINKKKSKSKTKLDKKKNQ